MEVLLLWLDELDDLVFGIALLWEPLRRIVLQIGFAAALGLHFSLPPIDYETVLAAIAFASVVVWLVAVLAHWRRGTEAPTAAA
ncbi:MAG TPA: hypothetical protein VIC71_01555 [Gammaproteobacteria bacterium]|jgi:hypothetical protein